YVANVEGAIVGVIIDVTVGDIVGVIVRLVEVNSFSRYCRRTSSTSFETCAGVCDDMSILEFLIRIINNDSSSSIT
ncbi:unnamed protein product, partial [Didymodactylos carnosus]